MIGHLNKQGKNAVGDESILSRGRFLLAQRRNFSLMLIRVCRAVFQPFALKCWKRMMYFFMKTNDLGKVLFISIISAHRNEY